MVRSVDRALDLLEVLMSTQDPLSLADISRETDLPASTAHRLLATLQRRQFVYHDPVSKRFTLNPRLLMSGRGKLGLELLREFAMPILVEVSQISDEVTNLSVRSGDDAMSIAQASSGRVMGMSIQNGILVPLYCTGIGKAILGGMSVADSDRILKARPLEPRTPNTLVDIQALQADLEEIRKRGYAIDNEEWEVGIRCVAAPFFDAHGNVLGSITVVGSAGRIRPDRDAELGQVVRSGAVTLSERLGFISSA